MRQAKEPYSIQSIVCSAVTPETIGHNTRRFLPILNPKGVYPGCELST